MAHSMIFAVRTMWINDIEVDELGFNAYVAGDDCACREAQVLIPHVTTAAVKQSLTRSAVRSMHPEKAHQLLQEITVRAIENGENVKPLVLPANPLLKIEFTNYGEAELAAMMPGCVLEKGITIVQFQAKVMLEAYRAMLVMTEFTMQANFC